MRLLEQQCKRMVRERQLLKDLESRQSNFTIQRWRMSDSGEVCLYFQLELAIRKFQGILVYPHLFPDVPAFIRPQKSGECWSTHQYRGSGVLCLEHGPDNWHPAITGVDLVESANRLLWNEVFTDILPDMPSVESRHVATLGNTLRGFTRRFVLTRAFRTVLSDAKMPGKIPLQVATTLGSRGIVTIPTSAGTPFVPIADVPSALAADRREWQGFAVLVESVDPFDALDSTTLKSAMGALWPWDEDIGDPLQCLVLHDATGGIRSYLLCEGTTPYFWPHRLVDFGANDEQEQRLPPSFSALSDARVAVVGLGSLGSKIAVSLARSGVRRFLLVDDDIFAPHNLVRNELNWLDVGFSKVTAVERELNRIAVGMDVSTFETKVAGQENPLMAAMLADDLTACTLVIDATATPQAFVTLAALTKRAQIPLHWGEIFAGGVGAMMARSRPKLDGDALDIRTHIHGVLSTLTPVPEGRSKNYELEGTNAVYVASDADVSALAASMSQFVLDSLCRPNDSEYPVEAYLMGYRKYWEFGGPFDTMPIDCSSARRPVVELAPLTDAETSEMAQLIHEMEDDSRAANNGPK
jgi:hypothetical protein